MIAARRRAGTLWPWLVMLVLSTAVTASIAWEMWPRTVDLSLLRPRGRDVAPRAAPEDPGIRLRLFFPQDGKTILSEEEREAPRPVNLVEGVRRIFRELAKGGGQGTFPPVSTGVEIRHAYLDSFGILYLDCNQAIRSLTDRDVAEGRLALSAVLTTLATNFSEVKRVQFLAEGRELEGRLGEVDLRRPVQPHFLAEETQPTIHESPQTN